MSVEELDLILKKDPIISTWPARDVSNRPAEVEKDYLTHARTHIALGDTTKHVDTIFKWVSGANKGAFIGAVLGDYGEGKTSLLLHIWAQSRDRGVLAIPPFEWNAFEEIVDATFGWTQHVLAGIHPESARRVQHLHEDFRKRTVEDIAREIAKEKGQKYEQVLATMQSAVQSGQVRLTEMSAARLLDFVSEVTEAVDDAGYKGVLILLDEPEVAAKKLGAATVQHFLFDLANELHRRKGDYGVFLSMPANFYATAQSMFSALPARLEARGCFPRLGDIYGPDFAQELWNRYVEEFDLGERTRSLISPLALKAVGQIGSSEHKDLSYGPRSVVSALSRAVDWHQSTGKNYEPAQLVQDVLDQEILVKPDYRSRILSTLHSPDVNSENREALTLLAAFPTGLDTSVLRELGYEDVLRPLGRTGGVVYRTAFSMGLRSLRADIGVPESNPLRDKIEEIDSEYAPDLRALRNALSAFASDVVPQVFREREGQQLAGWTPLSSMKPVAGDAYFGTMSGAFPETVQHCPGRAVMVSVTSIDTAVDQLDMDIPELDPTRGPSDYDLVFHFALRWLREQPVPAEVLEIREDVAGPKPALVRLYLDLSAGVIQQDHLADLVGADRMTPLWALNLLACMRDVSLPRQFEGEWRVLREMILREVTGLLLGQEFSTKAQGVAEAKLEERVVGSAVTLIGNIANLLLRRRYPECQTLIRQPRWQNRVDTYINALRSNEVPLACKRGRETWRPEDDVAERVFGTSRMNLTGGAFEGYESLVEIESTGRRAPLAIAFRIHPLEQEIRDLICQQSTGRKLKRGGKECWYIPREDVLPVILRKGYTVEELRKIVEIGRARQTFDTTEHQREEVLYCMPFDPDELKSQLRDKLNGLIAEIKQYKQLPDYVSSLDRREIEAGIEGLRDDADYSRLDTRMNKEFQQNHARLPGYFDRLRERLSQIRQRVVGVRDQLLGSRDVTQLILPRASSPWGAKLGRYVVPNLKSKVEELQNEAKELLNYLDPALERFSCSQQKTPAENLEVLLQGWSAAHDQETRAGALCDDVRRLLQQLQDFGKWCALLSQSDQINERLLELKRDPSHAKKADEFIRTFDEVSSGISDLIEMRNVEALPLHRQFQVRFEELDKEGHQYITSLKATFDKSKESVNKFLTQLNIGERVAVAFNPMDVGACYDQLFREGARLVIEQGHDRPLAELIAQERELRYGRDVLRTIDSEEADSLLKKLEAQRQETEASKSNVTPAWLREAMSGGGEGEVEQLSNAVTSAFEVVHSARKIVDQAARPKLPSDEQASAMFQLIPETGRVDLKDLVLGMMSQAADPTQALDTSLQALVELFRLNCIHIGVERRRR